MEAVGLPLIRRDETEGNRQTILNCNFYGVMINNPDDFCLITYVANVL